MKKTTYHVTSGFQHPGPSQLYAGPFSDRAQAEAAAVAMIARGADRVQIQEEEEEAKGRSGVRS